MAIEHGIIERIQDDWAWVKTTRTSACSHCDHKDHCQMVEGSDHMIVKAKNAVKAHVGDEVELYLDPCVRFKSIFMVYVLPIIGLMMGAFTAEALAAPLGISVRLAMPLLRIGGFFLAYLLPWRFAARLAERPLHPRTAGDRAGAGAPPRTPAQAVRAARVPQGGAP